MAQFFYEDGKGNAVDENGRPEPMDYIVDQNVFALESLTSHTEYLQNAASTSITNNVFEHLDHARHETDQDLQMEEISENRSYTRYTNEDKAKFFKLKIEKCMSASAAAKQLCIHVRAAQRLVKQYEEDPDSIFDSKKKLGRKPILNEEHKKTIIDYVDNNPLAVIEEITDYLIDKYKSTGLKVSRRTVHNFMTTGCNLSLKKAEFHSFERNSPEKINERYDRVREWDLPDMDFLTNCVFIDESPFHINMKRTRGWSKIGTPAIVTVPTTTAKTTTVLGAISASGLIKASVRIPRPNKKRKAGQGSELLSTGTVTGHYISVLKETLDEMDKYPQMKGHYLIMDNAPIHTSTDIAKYIEYRGYRYGYLPPYSPELNPIEQFWSVANSKMKRQRFLQQETLTTRIREACNKVRPSDFIGFVSYSHRCLEKCRRKESL